jgi:hypothetical protein
VSDVLMLTVVWDSGIWRPSLNTQRVGEITARTHVGGYFWLKAGTFSKQQLPVSLSRTVTLSILWGSREYVNYDHRIRAQLDRRKL